MTDSLQCTPRYIRNTGTSWEGAIHENGPWLPLPAPQSGLPWSTDGPAVPESREPASVTPEATGQSRPLGPDAPPAPPAPASDGEQEELAQWLYASARDWRSLGQYDEGNKCNRAAALIQQQAAKLAALRAGVVPVAVSERLPEGEPSDEDLYDLAELFNGDPVPAMRRALELWGRRPAAPPAPLEGEVAKERIWPPDEILNLSDGVEVNEVLGIIDAHTPEWV